MGSVRGSAGLATALIMFTAGVALGLPVPRLQYDFDESSSGSTTAVDHGVIPSANGTFINGATCVADTPAGFSRGAADLTAPLGPTHGPAVTSTVDTDKVDALSAMTLTLWMNLRAEPNKVLAQNLVFDVPTIPTPAGSGGWQLVLSAAGPGQSASNFEVDYFLRQSGGGGLGASGLNANHQWLFVAATMTTNSIRLYTGTETAAVMLRNSSGFTLPTMLDNSEPMYIGGVPGNGYTPPVWVDDVRVYDSALSQAEVEQIRASNVPEPGGLVGVSIAAATATLVRKRKR
jgi:hypothetical protein